MPPARPTPGSTADWLARARGDLAIATAPLPEGAFLEDLCFHAQQAVEKALKGVFVSRGLTFRYTHDLGELLTDLERHGVAVPGEVRAAQTLTPYAWEARYPGPGEAVGPKEHAEAVQHAGNVLAWAVTAVRKQ